MRNASIRCLCLAILLCAGLAVDAQAQYKWSQEPDLSENGVHVDATNNIADDYVIADDFLCTQTGPLTEISIWGAWAHDEPPMMYGGNVEFWVSIHADIPAEENGGFSMPGELLKAWLFVPGQFTVLGPGTGPYKGWFSPPTDYWYPCCTDVYQYVFPIDPGDTFIQEGTPAEPIVYWLAIQAVPLNDNTKSFGWTASTEHWNDDGTWSISQMPYNGSGLELVYPPAHPYAGQSIDLAFTIDGEGDNEGMDFGDAPDPLYPTYYANNGASHLIIPGFLLGYEIDAEPDGQPTLPDALGDDNNGLSDEDGVTFNVGFLPPGGPVIAYLNMINSTQDGMVDAWIDFNQNGSWADPGDQILFGQYVAAGVTTMANFNVPPDAVPGRTYARFRLSLQGGLSYDGPADSGEVEDYFVDIEGEPGGWKWERMPDLGTTGIDVNACDPYVLADDFLCELTGPITEIGVWGSWLDDALPGGGDPTAVEFTLSIHADIPAGQSPTGFSMPGEVLWVRNFAAGEFSVAEWATQIEEGWMDPPDAYVFPADWTCWYYNFVIPPLEAFIQQGTQSDPVVYWLDVQANPLDQEAHFGWKTTLDHWNDDAVWGMGVEPYAGPWDELIYPNTHQMEGQSIDLAFCLYTDPDMTDAPPADLPQRTHLRQNEPNPFNPQTVIRYELSAEGRATVEIFDARGQRIRSLVNEVQGTGPQSVLWNGRDDRGVDVPSGTYFYRLRAPGCDETMKMMLVR